MEEGEVSEEEEEKEKSMRLVMKFGGAAVADGGKIKVVADLIKKFKEEEQGKERNEMVVVTSAIFKVTDILHESAARVAKEGNVEKAKEFVKELKKKQYYPCQPLFFLRDPFQLLP
ncbi:hypothetical protein ES705_50152 [subsurface metagenome]